MKQYTMLADSITGIKGKQLLKGEVHNEGEFIGEHIAELVANGSIKELVAESPLKEKSKKD